MKFEDLEVWKRAARLSANIYKELRDLKDFGFKDQITRSGLSVPSNVAEGFERESQRESLTFLSYAKGSCGELRCQIYIGIDIGYTKNLKDRLKKHSSRLVKSTQNRLPLELVYYETCLDQNDAIRREKYLKTTYGRRYLKNRLKGYFTG